MADKNVFSFIPKDGAGDAGDSEEIVEQVAGLELDGQDADIPNSVLNRIIAVKEEHEKYMEIDTAYKAERATLEKKYYALKAEVWARRSAIISGGASVESRVPVEEGDDIKIIPSFWGAAMSNHGIIGQLITDEDMEALQSLADISCEYNDTWSGFTLTFTFHENKFFSNKVLRKVYEVSPDLLEEKAPELNSVEGTEINWLPGMNLCVTETKKKQKAKSGKNAGQVRYVTKTAPKPSFFHYFSDPKMHEDEEEEEEEDEKDNFVLSIDEDYEVAHAFRTELIPDALLWYTGEAMEEDDGDEEPGDDDENDSENDGEGEVQGSATTGFSSGGVQGGQDPNAPECKQS